MLTGLSGLSGLSGVAGGTAFNPADYSPTHYFPRAALRWQDAAGTVAATTGDPVRRWENTGGSSSVNALAPSDAARPTAASGGGLTGNGSSRYAQVSDAWTGTTWSVVVRLKLGSVSDGIMTFAASSSRLGNFGAAGAVAWYDGATIFTCGTSSTSAEQMIAMTSTAGVLTIYNHLGAVVTTVGISSSVSFMQLIGGDSGFTDATIAALFVKQGTALTGPQIAAFYAADWGAA